MYSEGNSEKIIGQILAKESLSEQTRGVPLRVASKANPWTEGLTPESMRKQITTSLTRMGVAKLDLFYLHAPDHKTPIEVTLEAVNKMYQEGLFDRFGLSNYAAWQVCCFFGSFRNFISLLRQWTCFHGLMRYSHTSYSYSLHILLLLSLVGRSNLRDLSREGLHHAHCIPRNVQCIDP